MKTKLWLDDVRPAPGDHFHAKTASQALAALKALPLREASFDHDLGSARMSGLWMLKVAKQQGIDLPEVVHLHTQNPVGRLSMGQHLEDLGYQRDHSRYATWFRPEEDSA